MRRTKDRSLQDIREAEFSFDSRGLYIFRAFLSNDHIRAARQELRKRRWVPEPWASGQLRVADIHTSPTILSQIGDALHQHPLTAHFVSYPHRLIESYALDRHSGRLDLHGGASELLSGVEVHDISARSWVAAGRLYSLRIKILVYLDNIKTEAAGRFMYVEGSHKAAFSFHRAFPGGRATAVDFIRTVDIRAGDAVWVNEALLHGAETKTSRGPRRLLAYSFGPSFMSNWAELSDPSLAPGYHSTATEAPK